LNIHRHAAIRTPSGAPLTLSRTLLPGLEIRYQHTADVVQDTNVKDKSDLRMG